MELVARAGVELEIAHQRQRVGAGLLGRLATVALLQRRQLIGVLGNLLRQLVEQTAALGGAGLMPHAVEAVARGAHGAVDVAGLTALNLGEGLAVGRVEHRKHAAGGRRHLGIGNEIELHGADCA